MDIELKDLYYPFSWKNPFIYFIMFISTCIYFVIFYTYKDIVSYGIIYPRKGIQIAIVSFFTIFFFHIFRASNFIKNINSKLFRSLLLVVYIIINIICIIPPAWTFYKYDSEKLEKYIHILPFKNSPCIKIKPTLIFGNISSLKYFPSKGDTGGHYIRFYLKNGNEYNFGFNNTSEISEYEFIVNLYQECDWLQDDIEKHFGSIDKLENKIYHYDNYFDIISFLVHIFFIWVFIVLNISLVFYIFKIKL